MRRPTSGCTSVFLAAAVSACGGASTAGPAPPGPTAAPSVAATSRPSPAPFVPPPATLSEGELVVSLPAPEMSVSRFAAAGELFTLCSERGTVELREGVRGRALRTERIANICRDAVFVAESGLLWAVSDAGRVASWRVGTPGAASEGRLEGASDGLDTLNHGARISDDGARVVASKDQELAVWSLPTGSLTATIPRPCAGQLKAYTFGADHSVLVGCEDGTVKRFGADSGALVESRTVTPGPALLGDGPVLSALGWYPSRRARERSTRFDVWGVSPDGGHVAFAEDGELFVWDVTTRAIAARGRGRQGNVAVSAGGGAVVVEGATLWRSGLSGDAPTVVELGGSGGEFRWVSAAPALKLPPGDGLRATAQDGRRVLVDVGGQGMTFAVRTADGRELGRVDAGAHCVHCSSHTELFWSPSLRFLALTTVTETATEPQVDFVWIDVLAGWRKRRLRGGAAPHFIEHVVVADDGKRFVTWGGGRGAVWDPRAGKVLGEFPLDAGTASAALLPGGDALVVGSHYGSVSRVALPSGETTPLFDGAAAARLRGAITEMAPSPAGDRLVVGDARGVHDVWEVATGRLLGTMHLLGDRTWVARDDGGRFAWSDGGERHLQLVQGLVAAPPGPDAAIDRIEAAQMLAHLGLE